MLYIPPLFDTTTTTTTNMSCPMTRSQYHSVHSVSVSIYNAYCQSVSTMHTVNPHLDQIHCPVYCSRGRSHGRFLTCRCGRTCEAHIAC